MRVAFISDIHGNLVSLEAVLADVEGQRVDRLVCLGDVASLGPQPREVIARLRLLGCPCIAGNHDADLLDLDLVEGLHPWVAAATRWCAEQLSPDDVAYLRSFTPLLEIPLGAGMSVCCYHGSPRSNDERILATTPAGELDEMLNGHSATVMVGGHNHVQIARRHHRTLVVDVGSVGQPLEQMPFRGPARYLPWAEYAIVGQTAGALHVELRRVAIDLAAVKRAARESNMPDVEGWVRCWTDDAGP
jgi:predicted phosphodiesterase